MTKIRSETKAGRRRSQSEWADIETWSRPEAVIDVMAEIECNHFACDRPTGARARAQRDARMMASLIEFTDLRVIDAGLLIGCNRDRAWNLRRKWLAMSSLARGRFLKLVELYLAKHKHRVS